MQQRIVGIDLGRSRHVVSELVGESWLDWSIYYTPHDLKSAAEKIASDNPSSVTVLVEDYNDPIVANCYEAGCDVYYINPRRLHHYRKFRLQAGHKDDVTDARLLVMAYISDPGSFRLHTPRPDEIARIYSLTKHGNQLRKDKTRLILRLQTLLRQYYLQAFDLDKKVNHQWIWELLRQAPSPDEARRLSRETLSLISARVRSKSVDDIVSILERPSLAVSPGMLIECRDRCKILVEQIILLHTQRKECLSKISDSVRSLPEIIRCDYELITSIPGMGTGTAPILISHAFEPIQSRNMAAYRALSGIAPITEQSGKMTHHRMRRTCNHVLRDACYHSAQNAVIHDNDFEQYYDDVRKRGHSHARALRSVSLIQTRRMFAILKTSRPYDGNFSFRS